MFKTRLLLLLAMPIICNAQNLGGNPPTLKWRQINSNASRVIFPSGSDSQALRISNVIRQLDTTTLYTIGTQKRKWNVLLLNQTTVPNAYVRLAPLMSELYMTPPQNNFSQGSIRWDDNLVIHEDRHMQQFSNFNNGLTKLFTFFLGQEGQLLANGITIPNYFFEGDAVWQETLVSRQGRGRMPAFYNGWKSMWLGKKDYSWMKIRSGSLRDYTPDHYESGYQLVAYGYEKYGEDFWRKVTADAVRFKGLFYAFNKAIERYSGRTYAQFRTDAFEYFKSKTLTGEADTAPANYITPVAKHNVVDYLFPAFVNDDTIIVTKQSYKEVSAFCFLINGKEQKLRVKDYVIDDYFSYRNGKVVYAAFQSDPRWTNRDYSVLQLLDIYTKEQRQLTFKSKYFSPDVNEDTTEIIAVKVNTDGSNFLHQLSTATGELIHEVPNPNNYFFTQTKYISKTDAVSAVRRPDGTMALVKVNFASGETTSLTPFTNNVLGYPFVKGDTVFYSMMDEGTNAADKIFAVDLTTMKNFQVTQNTNGVYQPAVNSKGTLLVTAFTAGGSRLQKFESANLLWKSMAEGKSEQVNSLIAATAITQKGQLALDKVSNQAAAVTQYRKTTRLFNFHSARPISNDPEYGYGFYGDNVLSSFSNYLSYVYNRNEGSHSVGYNAVYGGLFPFINMGAEYTGNRNIDTAVGKGIQFNTAKLNAGFSIPLSFVQGRTFKYFNIGGGYNLEQLRYTGIGKNVFNNLAFKYANAFISFSNVSRQARQHINPRWAQTFSASYRHALNFTEGRKLVTKTSFYFPGFSPNHSLVLNAAWQKKDTVFDLFSNNFPYSRGYGAQDSRRMYKLGINYHFPLFYPDWGFGNIAFIQRIRANTFFDYTNARGRLNGLLTNIINRSTGAEIYFDSKIWNALPATIGIRYSHLLDTDLRNPGATGRWEIILPINLIPN